jgi:hypothetical protein
MADQKRPVAAGTARELKPKSRIVRKVLKFYLILMLLLAAAHWGAGRYAQSRLDAALEAYRRAGEPIDPADFAQAMPPEDQNAAIDWIAADRLVDSRADAWRPFNRLRDGDVLPLDDAEMDAIAAIVRASRDALRRVDAATTKPLTVWPHTGDPAAWIGPVVAPVPRPSGDLINLLHAAALRAHQLGDDREALRCVRRLLLLARAVDQDPTFPSHLAANWADRRACDLIFQIVPRWSPGSAAHAGVDQLRPLIAILLDDDARRDALVRAMKGERMLSALLARAFADGRNHLYRGYPITRWQDKAMAYLYRPATLNDAPLALRQADAVIAAARACADWPALRSMAPWESPEYDAHPNLHPVVRSLTPWYERSFRARFNTMTDRHLAATLLALHLYAADHGGRAAADLDDLVPEYLPALPTDPMAPAGRTLGYRTGAAGPILYSVGDDATDNDGSEEPTNPRDGLITDPSYRRWRAKDAVVHLTPQPRLREPVADEADEY